MKTKIWILLSLVSVFCPCRAINNDTLPQSIKEIWIYDYFNTRGYTTAGVYGQMIRLESEGVSKFKLEQSEVDSLCHIIKRSSTLKIFHDKWPGGLIFADIVLKDGRIIKCFIVSGGISVDVFKKNYLIKNEKDIVWLRDFMNRIRAEKDI